MSTLRTQALNVVGAIFNLADSAIVQTNLQGEKDTATFYYSHANMIITKLRSENCKFSLSVIGILQTASDSMLHRLGTIANMIEDMPNSIGS